MGNVCTSQEEAKRAVGCLWVTTEYRNKRVKGMQYKHEIVSRDFSAFKYKAGNGKKHTQSFTLRIPSASGVKSRSSTSSRGVGRDRRVLAVIREANEVVENNNTETNNTYQADAVQWAMIAQKAFDLCTPSKEHLSVNSAVGDACDMSPTSRQAKSLMVSNRSAALLHARNKKRKQCDEEAATQIPACHAPPDVIPKNVDRKRSARVDKEVKRRTGFRSERERLAYIIIVCDGDVEKIKKTHSVLTWYEE